LDIALEKEKVTLNLITNRLTVRVFLKYIYKIVLVSTLVLLIAGCSGFVDSFSPIPRQKVLLHADGSSVRDCQGRALPIRGDAESFWRSNNLPKGTTEFVCVDGKAYLPGQEPKR